MPAGPRGLSLASKVVKCCADGCRSIELCSQAMFITKRYGGLSHMWTRVFPTEGAQHAHYCCSHTGVIATNCMGLSDRQCCVVAMLLPIIKACHRSMYALQQSALSRAGTTPTRYMSGPSTASHTTRVRRLGSTMLNVTCGVGSSLSGGVAQAFWRCIGGRQTITMKQVEEFFIHEAHERCDTHIPERNAGPSSPASQHQ